MADTLIVLPSFFLLTLASSHFKGDMRLHERRDGVPAGLTSKGLAPGYATLRFGIALVQNRVSKPSSWASARGATHSTANGCSIRRSAHIDIDGSPFM